jgi:integrase
MPHVKLTRQLVKSLPARADKPTEYRDELEDGLVLLVQPSGHRAFYCAYSIGRRTKRLLLGVPSDDYTLAKAREETRKARAKILAGQNPHAERRQARQQAALLVGDLVASMLEGVELKASTAREWARLRDAELTPLLQLPAGDLSRAEIRAWKAPIEKRSRSTAKHAFEVLRRAYTWGLKMELVTANPCVGIDTLKIRSSDRVLSTPEIRALWTALNFLGEDAYPDAVRLLLLTGVRKEMVLGAEEREFEALDGPAAWRTFEGAASWPRWTIPGGPLGRVKGGRDHVVPLSPQAVAVVRRRLAAAQGGYLFPKFSAASNLPPEKVAWLNRVLDAKLLSQHEAAWLLDIWQSDVSDIRLGRRSRGEKTTGHMEISSAWVRTLKASVIWRLRRELGHGRRAWMARWKLHELRHTLATHMREDLGVDRNVVALILSHVQTGGGAATKIYDRAELLEERRAALVAWGAWVESIASKKRPKVVLMRKRP